MGMLGPRRVAMSDEGEPLRPPAKAVVNTESWLDLTDLVFIDPVGTGYSRPAGKGKQADFSGLDEDTRSVGEFIRLWTTQNRRWASPKFLCGESYGTTRAASLAGHLQGRYGMYLNGIVLVSSVLNFQTIRFGTGNDLPYVMYLPTYAATAWYHGRVEGDLRDLVKRAEHFALHDYLLALAQGDRLPADERKRIAATLAQLTGLSAEFIERSNLRVSQGRFCKELLRAEGRTIGRLDARYKGIDRDAAGSHGEYDPSMTAISGPFSAAVKDYLRRELRYENDIQYRTLGGLGARWRFPEGRYVDVADTLRRAMTENPHLRVLVTSGYFDLATPHFASDYTVSHLGLDPTLAGHVRVRYYEAGHMMYVHKPSRERMKSDVTDFYAWALADPPPAAKED
jgi:carboxypeptidase C (cathepsin A)